MNKFSVVIVCKNEADVINTTLQSVQGITDDVVIYDNGSTDATVAIVTGFKNVKVHRGTWEGFGKTKSKAVQVARYDWILSLDADEALDNELQNSLQGLNLEDTNSVYRLQFKTFLGRKEVKWGEWGGDAHIRLFNRRYVTWNDATVHEALVLPKETNVKKIKGYVLHYTMKDIAEYGTKMTRYALLNAQKYFDRGKKATWVKRHFSGIFAFIKYYILMAGFLDGWEGLVCARMTAFYTSLKYARLYELQSLKEN